MNDTTTLLSMLALKFNIEHPSVEESYVHGYESAKAGIGEEDNPFATTTREHEHWSEGWWAGFYDEAPVFSLDTIDGAPLTAVNDHAYHDNLGGFFVRMLEITSVIGVAALVGYQVFDLVA